MGPGFPLYNPANSKNNYASELLLLSFSISDRCSSTCLTAPQSSWDEEMEECSQIPPRSLAEAGTPGAPPIDPLREQLIAISGGNPKAMTKFYCATIALVMKKAGTLLRAREDAEEIANDVYLYVWRYPLNYNLTRGSVQAWLSIMTRNRAIDRLRRRRFMVSLNDDQEGSLAVTLVNPAVPADTLLEQYEWEGAVDKALSTLNPLRRQLLDLSFFQELTHPEIARTVGLPLGTIKSHLRRVLRSL